MLVTRRCRVDVESRLACTPAVLLTGPRQAGKTTMARAIGSGRPSVYLDMESENHRRRLADAEGYLADHEDELVILDEVHRVPGLFQSLRGLIDDGRHRGLESGRFLLLGSASIDLLRQSGESLAGRVSHIELDPLDVLEVDWPGQRDTLWVRGGFPSSTLATEEIGSAEWRKDFIRTYLERDIPEFGPRIPASTLRRLWTMLSHQQGGILNTAQLARNLELDGRTVTRYVDLLEDLLMVRRLLPWRNNAGKRLVKSPKVYVRDSGLVHTLLGISGKDDLLGHPVMGASWEGCVIENVLRMVRDHAFPTFYRTTGGAEMDLVLEWPGGEVWAIEVKYGVAPRVGRSFYDAVAAIEPDRAYVVYAGDETFPLGQGAQAIGIPELCREVLRKVPGTVGP